MVTVAFAGGSGGLGYQLVQATLATQKHHVVLLSREDNPALAAQGVDVRPVDYSSHASLVRALQGVHTVISTLTLSPAAAQAQLNLVAAAKAAGATRFAPSEFAGSGYAGLDLYAPKAVAWEAVKRSGLEYTRFSCGVFMNLFGTGTPRNEAAALSGTRPWNFVVNMRAGTADLPGDGRAPCVFTDTRDIGRFLAAALDLERWDEEMGMVGDRLSFREVVALVEKVQRRKLLVKENSVEELQRMADTVPGMRFYNQVRIALARGEFQVPDNLNRLCPHVKPKSMEEYLDEFWSDVELPEPAWTEDKTFDASNMRRSA